MSYVTSIAYGGTFDPIHFGHLLCSQAVADHLGCDRVVLIPAAAAPLRAQRQTVAGPQDRLAMCRLAAETAGGLFEVSGTEIRRGGRSYTIDTVRQLKAAGWDEVRWLIGADQVAQLPQWHEIGQLVRDAKLLIMARPGWTFDWPSLPAELRHLESAVVPAPLVDISASAIRSRLSRGESIDGLTPPAVARYIRERSLYHPSTSAAQRAGAAEDR